MISVNWLLYKRSSIAQLQPLLLDGFKLDLRVYVLVTACNPLRIFVYKDGLVRQSCRDLSEHHPISANHTDS